MQLSGVNKLTLLDYPGHTACIFFTPGCNFRCGYCHNPEFVLPEHLRLIRASFIPEAAALAFLRERRSRIDGVVITGGEPTIQPDLEQFIRQVKALGYLLKLDTNGNRPDVLRRLLEAKLLDYVAMDFKTSLSEYRNLVGGGANPEAVRESLELLKGSGVEHEFRTTLVREQHTPAILENMRETLRGTTKLFLQAFRPTITLNPAFAHAQPFDSAEMETWRQFFASAVTEVGIRE